MNILLAAILAILTAGAVAAWVLVRQLRAEYRYISSVVTTFITPAGPNQPSPMASAAEALSSMVARAMAAQIKTTLMGVESGLSRGEKALQGDIALDVAAQTPLGGLLAAFPRASKALRRNPGLLDFALSAMSNLGARRNPEAVSPASSSNGDRPRFKLS